MSSNPDFRFRLNGIAIPEICIQRALVDGSPTGELQIAVRDEILGFFSIDDNSDLSGKDLPDGSLCNIRTTQHGANLIRSSSGETFPEGGGRPHLRK